MNRSIVNQNPLKFAFRYCAILLAFCAAFVGKSAAQTVIPAGTRLEVRIIEALSSSDAKVGDLFHGTLASPIVVEGRPMFAKGTAVTGEVLAVERSGRLSHPGELHLGLRSMRTKGRTYLVRTDPFVAKGDSHARSNVGKIGGGAAAGAIIGAIAGGGKGAALGAGVGAAAGTGVAAATGKKEATVESEAVLVWYAANPANYGHAESGVIRAAKRDPGLQGSDRRDNGYDGRYDDDEDRNRLAEFSVRDRQWIRGCYTESRQGLPPGLAKRDRLPPGLERHLQKNGTLPPGLQKKVQPLPPSCESRLPRLPGDWDRVVLSGRIIMLGTGGRILDMFWLNADN